MSTKLQKLTPAWHQEAIGLLNQHVAGIHETFIDSTKKAVWLGIFLNEIKGRGKQDGSIPHGEFGPWITKHITGLSYQRLNVYMSLARNVCEKGKIQIPCFEEFARGGQLPAEAIKLIEGKTQQQLCLQFKDPERGAGRLPGEGGRKKLSLAEQLELRKTAATGDWKHIDKTLTGYGDAFLLLPDLDVEAQVGLLEQHLKARKEWLKQPLNRRDSNAITKLLK